MKKRIYELLAALLLVVFFTACEQSDLTEEIIQDETGEINKEALLAFLRIKSELANQNGDENLMATNESLAGGRIANGRIAMDSLEDESDSLIWEDDGDSLYWEDEDWGFWETCAEITETVSDETVTVVVDYGEGCYEGDEYFQVFHFGKYTEEYTSNWDEIGTDSSIVGKFTGSTLYEQFGTKYTYGEDDEFIDEYIMDGLTTYSSESNDFFEGEVYKTNLLSEYQEDLRIEEKFGDEESKVDLQSDVKEEFSMSLEVDDFSYIHTILEATYSYILNDTSSYQSEVIEPLVMTSECDDDEEDFYVFTFVSGVEKITADGVTFTVDYGDGTCDNIITVTDENGNSEEIDLGEEFEDYEEEEDYEDEDSEDSDGEG